MDIKFEQHGSSENNGTIIELLVKKGEIVKKGQLLLVIELDKTNLENYVLPNSEKIINNTRNFFI